MKSDPVSEPGITKLASGGERPKSRPRRRQWPPVAGDFVLGSAQSPVAVCTLASRSLLPKLEGQPEIAIAGRVYTENVGIEKMLQNLLANPRLRSLIVCGRESRHRVGQAILSLHRNGLDPVTRVIRGATGPEPVLASLALEDVAAFQQRIEVIDLIGEQDVGRILERARPCGQTMDPSAGSGLAGRRTKDGDCEAEAAPLDSGELKVSKAEVDPPSAWKYDPLGFFLIRVDRQRQLLQLEHYGQDRRLLQRLEGETATALSQTVVRLGLVSILAHAAYLGRELAKAEAALRFGLHYEQDSPLRETPRERGNRATSS